VCALLFLDQISGVRTLPLSRRTFLEQSTAFGLSLAAPGAFAQNSSSMSGMKMPAQQGSKTPDSRTTAPAPNPPHIAPPMLHTLGLRPFVDPLPLPQVVRPTMHNGRRSVTLTMQEIHAKVHPDVAPTRMWSYGPDALAPLIEARAGEPLDIHWVNQLPTNHFLPIDHSLHGCGKDVPDVRTVAHLHGAKTLSKHDGYPEDWFTPGHDRVCHYPLNQEATTLWYHDHAMGLNRLNTYAGMFGMLLLRDKTEDALNLPSGKYEVPLILYDRDFTADGQLFYDVSGDPVSPWIPEFSADGILVNGKIRPYFEVEPRLYRFRILNTANSRFFDLSLSNDQLMLQIGSDQGLLPAPVPLKRMVLGCAERADVLIDLSELAGKTLHVRTGRLDILELRVASRISGGVSHTVPTRLRPVARIPESASVKTRTITLHEYNDEASRPMVMLLNRKHWHEPTTEHPKLNTTEIWEFVNLTEDTHPMHLHLVRFQILDRRVFDTTDFLMNKKLTYTAPAELPPSEEMGWKDIVQCPPGAVTRIIVPFEGYAGKYLYHCHILEHEANDMMRPFEVVA
jgi:spore coat protein A